MELKYTPEDYDAGSEPVDQAKLDELQKYITTRRAVFAVMFGRIVEIRPYEGLLSDEELA